mmetsp:Transcript_33345/g.40343  ORF Transcript_33345/g.40343 Transcript_33345/m.40343 type:complete len:692 (-) Transcript_33345:62-2137(-)
MNANELQAEFKARQQSILDIATKEYNDGTRPKKPEFNDDFALLAKANLTIPADQIEYLVKKTIASTKADFYLCELTRIMALSPGQYDEEVKFTFNSLNGAWMSKGDEKGVFWSENHIIMWHSCSMILFKVGGIPLPEGWRERIIFYLKDKIDIGFYEFFSPTYYPYSLAGLLNLHDFAIDSEIKELARKATLRLLKDFVLMTTEDGIFRSATGRLTNLELFTNTTKNEQQGQISALLGLGSAALPSVSSDFSGPSFGFLATSDIDVGEILAERTYSVNKMVNIGRSIKEFRKNATAALTNKRDRVTMAWSMGQYFHPDTAYELFENIDHYDLWENKEFEFFSPIQWIGPRIARIVSIYIENFFSASILNGEIAIWRNGGAMLTSLQNGYFRGMRSPAQQQPFLALAGPASVFTLASGDFNPTFSKRKYVQSQFPHIKQNSNVALLLYNPTRDIIVFLKSSLPVSLYWPNDLFSEDIITNNWKIARHEQSYVAMWVPCLDDKDGYIVCTGEKQVWASVVGTNETHGSFDNFTQIVSNSAPVISSGKCLMATLAVDGQEVSIDKWCRDFGAGNKALTVAISYVVVTLVAAILLYLRHRRTNNMPLGEEPGFFFGVMPRSVIRFMLGVLFYFVTFPILVFAFAVGFYGDGSPAAIAISIIGVVTIIVLHAIFVWYSRKKHKERQRSTKEKIVSE